MVTETWLTDAIPDAALHISGFTIVRRDRSNRRGGGVAIYIRESLPFKIRPDCNNPDYECLYEVVFMFRGFAVDKIKVARMHVGVNTRASILLLCMNA